MRIAMFSSLAKNTGCWLKLGYLAESLKRQGVEVVVFDPLPAMPLFLDFLLSIPWNMIRVLFCRCDVLFGAKPFLQVTLPFLFAKLLRKKIWTVVDVDDLDYEYRSGFLRSVVYVMQTTCTRFMDMVTYHNEALVEPLKTVFRVDASKLYCLKQGVDFAIFDREHLNDTQALQRLRERYHLSEEDEVIVYSAHLNAASCLDGVLQAFQRAWQSGVPIKLLVIGGGDREQHYRQTVECLGLSGAVIFTGYLTPSDVAGHVLLGDMALVYYDDGPANRYRCSMKLRELLGMGRIVVCNRTGETPVFTDYVALCDSDFNVMAETIVGVINRKSEMKQMADRGCSFIHDQYDWATIGAEFLGELNHRMACV